VQIILDTISKKFSLKKKKQKNYKLFDLQAYIIIKKFWEEYCWHFKYTYQFSWLGFPVIQLTEDLIQVQEYIVQEKPNFIIETGIARGGSIIFYSSICKLIGFGKVIGVDIKIKKRTLQSLKKNSLSKYFKLFISDSTNEKLIKKIKNIIKNKKTLVILDSNHDYEHVLKELNKYGNIICKNSTILITDGIVDTMNFSPRRLLYNKNGGPIKALKIFLKKNNKFSSFNPKMTFNHSLFKRDLRLTHFPMGWIKKVRS